MSEVRHIKTPEGKKVEILITAEELMEALRQLDNAFKKVAPNYDNYRLTFKED